MVKSFTPALKKKLIAASCRFVRSGKGDHEVWYGPITERRFVVDQAIKSRHTANAVMKQAGLPVRCCLHKAAPSSKPGDRETAER